MKKIIAIALFFFAGKAVAALSIFACEPEWGALATEIGGERAKVYVAITGLQDPHRVDARPSLIARARSADLMVCTGAQLEEGWLPLVLTQSGNARIQAGQPGYFEAARFVELLDKPARLDRALGDIHAEGNPHIHLHPGNVAKVAAALAERMAQLDVKDASFYIGRNESFLARWREATAGWEKKSAPLKGMPIVVHHRDLAYLVAWLGMREIAALEPKPGLPPGSAHLAEVLERHKRDPARAVTRAAYNDPRPSEWLAARAGIPAVVLPYTVGGSDKAKDLFTLYEDTLARLLAVAR
jgi:zinc/manganese transport system substrate-binding protein